MPDKHRKKILHISQYDLKPLIPAAIVLILYVLFMPTFPGTPFSDLELHQQMIGLSAPVAFIVSLSWWIEVNFGVRRGDI